LKRGRPALRSTFKAQINALLASYPFPVTTRTVQKRLSTEGRVGSWHTIRKYLDELAEEGVVIKQQLPVTDKNRPFVLYQIRGCKSQPQENFCKDF